jgi:hypothetical protein
MLRAERQVLSERRPHTKQIQKSKGHGGSAGRRQEPLAVDPRDPDIVHARRIAHLSPFHCRDFSNGLAERDFTVGGR